MGYLGARARKQTVKLLFAVETPLSAKLTSFPPETGTLLSAVADISPDRGITQRWSRVYTAKLKFTTQLMARALSFPSSTVKPGIGVAMRPALVTLHDQTQFSLSVGYGKPALRYCAWS